VTIEIDEPRPVHRLKSHLALDRHNPIFLPRIFLPIKTDLSEATQTLLPG
jgi:hypothetical protein